MDTIKISNELNAMVCEIHHKSAKVILTANPETKDSGKWASIKEACCQEFADKITQRASDLFSEGMGNDLMKQLKW